MIELQGDITSSGELSQIQSFRQFLDRLPHKDKVVIAGNHDVTLHVFHSLFHIQSSFQSSFYQDHWWRFHSTPFSTEDCAATLSGEGIHYLQDSEVLFVIESSPLVQVILHGMKIYGTPWVMPYHDWAYNLGIKFLSI